MSSHGTRAQLLDSPPSLNDPGLYLDRELSLLAFQQRVLEEAQDPSTPLLERVKFLSILFSNLDEFFMVRVAVLKQKAAANLPDGGVQEQLERIHETVNRLMEEAYRTWRELEQALKQADIELRDYADLNRKERAAIDGYFR